jgi:hypothetical protein
MIFIMFSTGESWIDQISLQYHLTCAVGSRIMTE